MDIVDDGELLLPLLKRGKQFRLNGVAFAAEQAMIGPDTELVAASLLQRLHIACGAFLHLRLRGRPPTRLDFRRVKKKSKGRGMSALIVFPKNGVGNIY